MSGLLALLDDVAAIAKLAAANLDDIAGQAAKVGSKTAGVLIDDAAVTPKYVTGLPAARELPIVWKIARGSLFNKLAILLPAALLLDWLAPWLLIPLVMIGGAYLCFEGAEKIAHAIWPGHDPGSQAQAAETLDAAHLEEKRVAGAIKTDFILSAEIMTIALAAIDVDGFWMKAGVLIVVAIGVTVLVYGAVALIVKADDVGLKLSRDGALGATRALGRGIVAAMPTVLTVITVIGTAAMLWVGGDIITHGLHELGLHAPEDWIKGAGAAAGSALGGVAAWLASAGLSAAFGLALGLLLIPLAAHVIEPAYKAIRGQAG